MANWPLRKKINLEGCPFTSVSAGATRCYNRTGNFRVKIRGKVWLRVFGLERSGQENSKFLFKVKDEFVRLLKEKFTPEWLFIFFTPIKRLYKNMLFTKISASNER